jgi:hypothetical protein
MIRRPRKHLLATATTLSLGVLVFGEAVVNAQTTSTGQLTAFGQAVVSDTGQCGFRGVVDDMAFDTGDPANGSFVLTGGTYRCNTTLTTAAPSQAVVARTAPFNPGYWNGMTFTSASQWTLVLTPSGRAIYTCTY